MSTMTAPAPGLAAGRRGRAQASGCPSAAESKQNAAGAHTKTRASIGIDGLGAGVGRGRGSVPDQRNDLERRGTDAARRGEEAAARKAGRQDQRRGEPYRGPVKIRAHDDENAGAPEPVHAGANLADKLAIVI